MLSSLRILTRVALFTFFAICVGYFSASPRYQYGSPDSTTIKLSLSHATERIKPCIRLTPEEIAELAPNMRTTERCERERLPLRIQLEIDAHIVVDLEAPPSGMWGDGPASVYQRFDVAPGPHRVTARLRDTARSDGWDYSQTKMMVFVSGRYVSVTFRANAGGFAFR